MIKDARPTYPSTVKARYACSCDFTSTLPYNQHYQLLTLKYITDLYGISYLSFNDVWYNSFTVFGIRHDHKMNLYGRRGKSVVILAHFFLFINCFSVTSVCSQNAINPRRSKSNLTSGVLKCPNIKGSSKCKMPCVRDEHCENYGALKCCPVGPGHLCKAECREPVLNLNGEGICYDIEMARQYVIGNVFVMAGVCCRCQEGGTVNCTGVGSCKQGCYYGSTYYNDGEAISRSSCRNCSCHNGTVSCTWNTNCTQEKCKYKGKIYTLEHIIRLDNGCKECVCQYRGWSCTAITCNAARSSSVAVKIPSVESATFAALILFQYLLKS